MLARHHKPASVEACSLYAEYEKVILIMRSCINDAKQVSRKVTGLTPSINLIIDAAVVFVIVAIVTGHQICLSLLKYEL